MATPRERAEALLLAARCEPEIAVPARWCRQGRSTAAVPVLPGDRWRWRLTGRGDWNWRRDECSREWSTVVNHRKAAEKLHAARLERREVPTPTSRHEGMTTSDAYRIQEAGSRR